MNVLILASVIHFVVGDPQHGYPLRETMTVTNVPASIAVLRPNAISIRLDDREALWGLGERFDSWNQRGRVVECWARDMAQGGSASSYFAVPFVMSSKGWGIFVNCAGKVRFDSRGSELKVDVPENGVDAYLFKGTPREMLEEYTQLVGRPASPPAWVFQPWLSRNSYLSAADVDHVLDKMDEHGLKAGVVVLEAWAQSLQNFRFEEHRYPKPAEWIDRLHQRGVHIVCWETPSIWTSASTYEDAKTNDFLVLNADGSEYVTDWLEDGRKIDFRKPAARTWWTKLHEPLVAMGVDGFKTDGGERMPDPWFHNLQPSYYQHAVPAVTFARSANPACNGLFWAGDQNADWNSLRRVVRAGLSAAMSGFPYWGHDIGGYTGTPTKALYIRWLQLGAFSPIMQLHGITAREPWYYDAETIQIAKKYFDVRWALQPYLLAMTGAVWRPLAMEFPEDSKGFEVDDEFMLGEDLLVAPVLNEFDERRVYVPAGKWRDLWTGTPVTGPTNFLLQVALDRIPVFVREDRLEKFETLGRIAGSTKQTCELAGARNERGVVPTVRVWRGQSYEKIFLRLAEAGEVRLDVPPNFEVLPARQQRGERIAFYVMWPKECVVGTYPVSAGTIPIQLVKLPPWPQAVREDGYVDLAKTNETSAIFEVEHDTQARLWLGSGDGMSVWLNDKVVFDERAHRTPEPEKNVTDIALKKGRNSIRVKLTHGHGAIGPNGFYLRFSDLHDN